MFLNLNVLHSSALTSEIMYVFYLMWLYLAYKQMQ
jgi:hypothetical protein